MFNNAKLGVDFKNIKVAKGGCVVAGQAELSHIDVALLSEEQRKKLAEIYAAYNLALTVADSLAPEISETINSLSDLYKKIAEKTQAILDKVNSGMKISSAEQKKLEVMKKSAKDIAEKQVMYFTERFGKNGSEEIINLINTSSQSCMCQQYIAPTTPSKGPNAELEEWFFYSEDCAKCLQEDIKKQQEMVTLSKAMEDKLNAIKGQKMECGCGWNSIKLIWQSVGDNGDCEEIVKVMNKFKEDLQTSGTATVKIQYMPFDTNKPLGQISIGDICIDNFSLELLPHDASGVQVYSSKKDQYDDSAVKISGNSLIFNDYQSPTTKTLTLKTDNNEQTILVEKWLFEKVFFNKVNSNNESNDLKYQSGREYGWLSASQESQNPCDIGYDEAGGCSYGKHQMAVRTGKINEFFLWLSVNYKNDLKETYKDITEEAINLAKDASSRNECKNCKFTQVFNKFCNDDKFISLAHKFIAERNYKPVYDKIISNFGDTKLFKNLNSQDEESLKEMCYSLGVQHGGAFRVFEMALLKDYTNCSESDILDTQSSDCSASKFPKANPLKSEKDEMIINANKLTMTEYIKRVYAARKLYVKMNKVEGWKNMVRNRYKTEENEIFDKIY